MSKWEEALQMHTEPRWRLPEYSGISNLGVACKDIKAGEFVTVGKNVHLFVDVKATLEQSAAEYVTQEDENAGEDILEEALRITSGERNNAYGPPTQDFARTAAMWSAIFGRKFSPHEVAMAMMCLKLSRMSWDPSNRDHHCDLAGYARCGWQCVEHEMENGELE